jgi:hypothetical protein
VVGGGAEWVFVGIDEQQDADAGFAQAGDAGGASRDAMDDGTAEAHQQRSEAACAAAAGRNRDLAVKPFGASPTRSTDRFLRRNAAADVHLALDSLNAESQIAPAPEIHGVGVANLDRSVNQHAAAACRGALGKLQVKASYVFAAASSVLLAQRQVFPSR